jgi:hypothetical protein
VTLIDRWPPVHMNSAMSQGIMRKLDYPKLLCSIYGLTAHGRGADRRMAEGRSPRRALLTFVRAKQRTLGPVTLAPSSHVFFMSGHDYLIVSAFAYKCFTVSVRASGCKGLNYVKKEWIQCKESRAQGVVSIRLTDGLCAMRRS